MTLMDNSSPERLRSGLPSPWLRLAHEWGHDGSQAKAQANQRHLLDHEFIFQLNGAGWLGFEEGWVAMPEGSVALIPPGLVHGQGPTRASHLAVHFDLQAQIELGPDAMVHYHDCQVAPAWAAATAFTAIL